MADVLLHNTLIDQADAHKAASSKIDYEGILGKTMRAYLIDIINANQTTGSPYYSGGGGSTTRYICDLSDACKIMWCTCNYAGSGQNCGQQCASDATNVWTDGSVLGSTVSEKTMAEIRAIFITLDNGGTLTKVYDTSTTAVEKDIYAGYISARRDYTADATILPNWYNTPVGTGGGASETQGQRLSETDYLKVCSTGWKYGCGPATCTWTVPANAICAKFQVWGAGIGTNSACCCGGGQFGATGAYSEMTIKVTPGDSYSVCAGCSCSRYCCSNSTPSHGCASGVTGNGICCLNADGAHCYNGNCYEMNRYRVGCSGFPGGECRRFQNPYCTTSGPCYCSYSEYCFENSCGTCGTVPIYPGCCWIRWCSCATTACEISGKSGTCRGHFGIHGGGCLDSNNYGWHSRPPVIDADSGSNMPRSCGCNIQTFSSGTCCGGCSYRDYGSHPGQGGHGTHMMGGATNHFGDTGRSGLVQISWIKS